MISENLAPRSKQDLIKALQKMKVQQIEIIEPYDPSQDQALTKTAKQMIQRSGNVSIILVRSQ